ncbi:restriction endonuclease [Mycobacteroides abscessus]|uniref:restriction endonuclease n=1 Tax=Mycobacteroides abscessus TaxID=36809 RepID=UPI0014903DD1|nr:restriction endonuclease [Mycobacteroides abscessus]
MAVFGVHNDALSAELIDGGFVSIGWDNIGDLRDVGLAREELKTALAGAYPDTKPRAIAAWAGTLLRFADEISEGDVVVAPYRPDSTINIGVVTGPYEFHRDAPTHRHRRPVRWEQLGVSRTIFSQAALYEIGSLLTVFRVRNHADEFLALLGICEPPRPVGASSVDQTEVELAAADEPRAGRIERHTRDFVLERLESSLSHQEFEEFTADLLRAMGYEARVTAYTQDCGVDVLAHRDPLGVEPPLIKVQCKHMTNSIGAPEVQQLIGTQAQNELSLFVTLGSYSRDAMAIERNRQGLRLISGEALVDLVLRNYDRLPPRWRSIMPLRQVLVVDDSAGI